MSCHAMLSNECIKVNSDFRFWLARQGLVAALNRLLLGIVFSMAGLSKLGVFKVFAEDTDTQVRSAGRGMRGQSSGMRGEG